ncbi:hypothetical protein [Oleiharenicola lentus]|uniref:hypothetical protein n=1 Tax=Oleiharenicola lentus TaxID=2508720 RepID=UPI003F664970
MTFSLLRFLRPFVAAISASALFVLAAANEPANPARQPVNYEAFGAIGDGVTDDLPAIVKAHAHANAHGLRVETKAGATYHLGRRALTAIIATDTDWGASRFIIDDTDVENHRVSLFSVQSLLEPVTLTIPRLTRDQRRLDVLPPRDCWVRVENSHKKRYIREGLNQNGGSAQRDCFILRRDGSIEGDIDWDYDVITKLEARAIDEQPLVLRGGVFTTTANQMKQEKGYNYWLRNIAITRSNTTVVGLTHHIVGEGEFGHPYNGFLAAQGCANITFRDCFVTGHKTYSTIGAAGKPVSMGTYDLIANEVVNFTMSGVRMDNVCDTTRWGVIGTNFCKNILLENCMLSRMDTHQGVSGTYTIRGTTLGHAGLNAIGRGTLTVENSTLNGRALIALRPDYGSTWEGLIVIRNSRWIPGCGAPMQPYLLSANNRGQHDFGYPCFMPSEIRIDGLVIDDSQHPKDYRGPFLFNDFDGSQTPEASRPFPYQVTDRVTIRGVTTTSGKQLRISPDPAVAARVKVIERD